MGLPLKWSWRTLQLQSAAATPSPSGWPRVSFLEPLRWYLPWRQLLYVSVSWPEDLPALGTLPSGFPQLCALGLCWAVSLSRMRYVLVLRARKDGVPDSLVQDVAWIPLHVAADTILEMTVAAAAPSVLHLAHPRPVPWLSVLSVVARELNVPLVSYADWLRALEESVKDPRKSEVDHMRANPALRLLPFFRGVQTGRVPAGYEAMGLPLMDTRRAQEVVPGLRSIAPLGEADVLAWLEFWKTMHVL
jgi:hypothetical protein